MAGRILIIRGGAIGDFVLTLPAIRLIREAFPENHIEVLGYQHILEVAAGRYYADATRSIEYGAMAGFFHPTADLDHGLCEYFASFHQVISYLFDPDEIFAANLKKAGVRNLLQGPGKLGDEMHAAVQLASPLAQLGLFIENPAAEIFPTCGDIDAARSILGSDEQRYLVVHPGSGSPGKNWPLSHWQSLIGGLLETRRNLRIVVVGGEADMDRMDALRQMFGTCCFVQSPPLPVLGALCARAVGFIGHDSGVSHIAAASGARALLLFGPTDPEVWAPKNPDVRVIRANSGKLEDITVESVLGIANDLLPMDAR